MFAFPLQFGATLLGVLDVYRSERGSLSREKMSDAQAFADVALTMLLDDVDRAESGESVEGLADSVTARALPGAGHGDDPGGSAAHRRPGP